MDGNRIVNFITNLDQHHKMLFKGLPVTIRQYNNKLYQNICCCSCWKIYKIRKDKFSGALWQGPNCKMENYGFLAAVTMFEKVLQSFLACQVTVQTIFLYFCKN